MDGFQFISSIVAALAWPAVVLVIVLLLRQPILELVRLLRRAKYGDFEFEFAEMVKESVAVRIVAETTEKTGPLTSEQREKIKSVITSGLTAEERKLVILRYYNQLEIPLIAKMQGQSDVEVSETLNGILTKLRQEIISRARKD